jgi:hypothetical protein
MWTLVAFSSLGLLVGILTGLTAANVTSSLLALLFAFAGGSAVAFLNKLDAAKLVLASQCVTALSLACLLGVFSGVIVAERQLLTPEEYRAAPAESTVMSRKVLKKASAQRIGLINQLYRDGRLSADAAYEALYKAVVGTEAHKDDG